MTLLEWRKLFLEFGTGDTTARAVGLVIASHMGMDGGKDGKCFPSYSRICAGACIQRRAAINAVNRLVREGWLIRQSRRSGSGQHRGQTSNSYIAAYPPGLNHQLLDMEEPAF